MNEYGYVRVSAADQNEARQVIEMEKLGLTSERIFIDKQSGKDFNRPEYIKLIKLLRYIIWCFVKVVSSSKTSTSLP